jgi:hypothetical protein
VLGTSVWIPVQVHVDSMRNVMLWIMALPVAVCLVILATLLAPVVFHLLLVSFFRYLI